ncbi:hypothetical protein ABB02_00698 [Clostridiaceae bacterium JG1575]|nr:hypothetical protein ABB02_00698 [Clostridiaceae bacterium JG1575]
MYLGPRIQLRALDPLDLPRILSYVNDYETYSPFTESPPLPKSAAFQARWLEGALRPNLLTFAIALNETGTLLGTCQLRDIQPQRANAFLSIIFLKEAQGKGYGKEALTLLLDLAFQELNLHKVSLQVYETNTAAQALYEKMGFQKDGTFKKHVYRKGRYEAQHLFSLLDREYASKQRQVPS